MYVIGSKLFSLIFRDVVMNGKLEAIYRVMVMMQAPGGGCMSENIIHGSLVQIIIILLSAALRESGLTQSSPAID